MDSIKRAWIVSLKKVCAHLWNSCRVNTIKYSHSVHRVSVASVSMDNFEINYGIVKDAKSNPILFRAETADARRKYRFFLLEI